MWLKYVNSNVPLCLRRLSVGVLTAVAGVIAVKGLSCSVSAGVFQKVTFHASKDGISARESLPFAGRYAVFCLRGFGRLAFRILFAVVCDACRALDVGTRFRLGYQPYADAYQYYGEPL